MTEDKWKCDLPSIKGNSYKYTAPNVSESKNKSASPQNYSKLKGKAEGWISLKNDEINDGSNISEDAHKEFCVASTDDYSSLRAWSPHLHRDVRKPKAKLLISMLDNCNP